MNIISLLKKLSKQHRYNAKTRSYLLLYKKITNTHSKEAFPPRQNEDVWLERWHKYDKEISPISYRIFSQYVGENLDIIPLEFCACVIEPVLNPEQFSNFYDDKNSYDFLLSSFNRPQTWLRNIDGFFYDQNYELIKDIESAIDNITCDSLIIKPTRESSGKGVKLFSSSNGKYVNSNGETITKEYLAREYNKNFIVQSRIQQSVFMAQFNESSLNTIRIATYRSIKTGQIHVINSILRIGRKGSIVDNAHAGGMFVGIDIKTGRLGRYACNWLGKRLFDFNGINFRNNSFIIPNYEEIKHFAVEVAKKVLHSNLVTMDIAIDNRGNPIIIEINIGGFGAWVYQFAGNTVFGEFTEEIINHCLYEYQKLKCTTCFVI